MTKPTGDWRDNILNDLPEGPIPLRGATYPTALEVIKVAAYNRRMSLEEYIGRAALAVAAYDTETEWDSITDKEPPLRDLRRHRLPRRRLRGRGFGPWKITGMSK